jgi:two-component system, sensor histidine kinase and response regulator
VAALRRLPYALVLMDCQMPELDGYAAATAIRVDEAERARPRSPIIALTANAMPGDRERCLAAGMDDYITKPVTITALEATLARWLATTPDQEGAPALAPGALEAVVEPTVLAELRALAEADPALLAELFGLFLAETPGRLAALAEAARTGDTAAQRRIAHTLVGSCGSLGLADLATLAREVERLAPGEPDTAMLARIDRLTAAFARVRPVLVAAATRPAA